MENKEPSYFKYQPLLLALCTLIGLYGGYKFRLPSAVLSQNQEQLDQKTFFADRKIKETFDFLDAKYIDSIDFSVVSDYLIEQLMYGLDPYSEYISKEKLNSYYKDLDASSAGLGIKTIRMDSTIVVTELHPNSPAWNHGIFPGCHILKVNDKKIGSRLIDLDSLSMVNDGPVLTLDCFNPFETKEYRVKMETVDLPNPSIPLDFADPSGFFYIKLERLGHNSYREFMRKMEEYCFEKEQSKLILDLRGNSGGLLNAAADILNQLVPVRDKEMFSVAYKNGNRKSYKATGKPFFRLKNIIILTDEHTASSAEIMAGCLQDLKLAKIIGENTKGKATVLEAFKLSDGSQILLATSRIYLPSGRSFQKPYSAFSGDSSLQWLSSQFSHLTDSSLTMNGITPDIKISDSEKKLEYHSSLRSDLEEWVLNHFDQFLHCFNPVSKELDHKKMEAVVLRLAEQFATKSEARAFNKNEIESELRLVALRKTLGLSAALRAELDRDDVFKMASDQIGMD